MSCYSVVTLNLEVIGSADEIKAAALSMGLNVRSASAQAIETETVRFTRDNIRSVWKVSGSASFNVQQFRREVARAKVLSEAKRQGYRVTQDIRQGERIVIRMKLQ